MESDSDFVSVENKEHQWGKLMEEWENEKKRKMKELAWSERACREPEESESDENEDDENFHGESHEDLIERTRDVLQRHGGEGSSGHRTHATADGKTELLKVDVETLRYSQFTCAPYFQCGKSVSQLVNELLDGKVTTSAPFLELTIFEDIDEESGETVLKSADNRRLFALKEFAKKSGRRVMVYANLLNLHTLAVARKIVLRRDRTPGHSVVMRSGGGKGGNSFKGNGSKGHGSKERTWQGPSPNKKKRRMRR